MIDIKKLETKKILKELDYIESDYEYKTELTNSADSDFIKCVNILLESHPILKDIFDRKLNIKADESYMNIENIQGERDINNEGDNNSIVSSEVKNPKIKKIYREIAKATHPDRVSSKKLNDIYLKATKSYENNDIVSIYSICEELSINYDIDEEDNKTILERIENIKSRISFMESTLTWKWYHSNDEKEKEQIVLRYIKTQLDT